VALQEQFMENLMKMEDREIKQGKATETSGRLDIAEYQKRISDKDYLEHAIKKIATDLAHYLTK
jgi:hypothetical protein